MVKTTIRILCALLALTISLAAHAACEPGSYGIRGQNIVALTPKAHISPPGLGYLFLDGRFGNTLSESSPVRCVDGAVFVRGEYGAETRLERRTIVRTSTRFASVGAELAGELLEPTGPVEPSRPLLVIVRGPERSPAIDADTRALVFAAQGIAVFIYDKRGTGQSGGVYSQNFERLADDAAAALTHARQLAKGRFDRAGYFCDSQGGRVAPLAATRSDADFVAVGFGLVGSPIDEDRDRMISEAQRLGFGQEVIKQIHHLSDITAHIVTSHFSDGFEELDAARKAWRNEEWTDVVRGKYSGHMLRMSDAALRRAGRALFDNLDLIWDYDSLATLRKLDVPLLWVIAAEDRKASAERTMRALTGLKTDGHPIDAYVFPQTDHGRYEFVQRSIGSQPYTRVTDGYYRLLADWIHGEAAKTYGRGAPLKLFMKMSTRPAKVMKPPPDQC